MCFTVALSEINPLPWTHCIPLHTVHTVWGTQIYSCCKRWKVRSRILISPVLLQACRLWVAVLLKKEQNVSNAITLNYIEAKITIVRCTWCLGEKALFSLCEQMQAATSAGLLLARHVWAVNVVTLFQTNLFMSDNHSSHQPYLFCLLMRSSST